MSDHLTTEQIAEVKEAFSLFDKSNSGQISLEEMCIIFRALGQTPTQVELESMMRMADPDGTGSVGFADFLSIYSKCKKEPIGKEEVVKAFTSLDETKSGLVTIERLRQLLMTKAEPLTEEEFSKLVKYANPDQDGNIKYENFINLMMMK